MGIYAKAKEEWGKAPSKTEFTRESMSELVGAKSNDEKTLVSSFLSGMATRGLCDKYLPEGKRTVYVKRSRKKTLVQRRESRIDPFSDLFESVSLFVGIYEHFVSAIVSELLKMKENEKIFTDLAKKMSSFRRVLGEEQRRRVKLKKELLDLRKKQDAAFKKLRNK